MSEPTEVARYVFSIQLFQYPDGHVEYETNNKNLGILHEIIIAHLEAVLRKWRQEFYDRFGQGSIEVKKE